MRSKMAPRKRRQSQPESKVPKLGDSRKAERVGDGTARSDADMQPIDRESLLNLLHHTMQLPMRQEESADGTFVFVDGDPGEVVVRVARNRINVSVFAIVREPLHTPVVRPQPLMTLNWKVVPAARLRTILQEMIETARKLRRAKFRTCERCGETKPPEWMHDNESCQGCTALPIS